jgi:hypothetical protein
LAAFVRSTCEARIRFAFCAMRWSSSSSSDECTATRPA